MHDAIILSISSQFYWLAHLITVEYCVEISTAQTLVHTLCSGVSHISRDKNLHMALANSVSKAHNPPAIDFEKSRRETRYQIIKINNEK
jgi:hypothetical protein